jgi:ribosomal protein S18 acetylase RimI-like enzyme
VLTIRAARPDDLPFLEEVVRMAADWRPSALQRTVPEVMSDPSSARYVQGWPIEGDFGLVAEEGFAHGATWWRFFQKDNPGYGFVDEATPELTIGVLPDSRGKGVGTRLLQGLIAAARSKELPALSLSVEPENPAMTLYRGLGFIPVADIGGAVTMVVPLGA